MAVVISATPFLSSLWELVLMLESAIEFASGMVSESAAEFIAARE